MPRDQLPKEGVVWVATGEELDYYMSVQKERCNFPKMVEVKIDRPLEEIEDELSFVVRQIDEKEIQLKEFIPYNLAFHELLMIHTNKESLTHAKGVAQEQFDGHLFVISGWVPVDELDALYNFCKEQQIYYAEIKIDEDDKIPTYLKNRGMPQVGEDLVHIYDTPSENDKDPSLWVLAFFTLFFSIIIGDAGYGAVFLLISLYFWYKFPGVKGVKRRFLVLGTTLSIGCVAWGVLASNYFGIQLALDNPLRKVSLIQWLVEKKADYHIHEKDAIYKEWVEKYPSIEDQEDPYRFIEEAKENKKGQDHYPIYNKFADQIMMELMLMIASIHICLSMGRYLLRNWAFSGWIIFIIGAYLYVPVHLNYTSMVQFVFGVSKPVAMVVGRDMMIVGMSAAAILALIQHRLTGLLELATLIQIVSDILSYLRLYALGLAGGIIAVTINEMAAGMPIVIGFILLLFAHTFNMALAIMGGVIHGLRLNFLEWYHYSFEGGGKVFKPLRIRTKDD
jgi:V/A-type H+-transporting ATPase subunit I